jgi:hypothetical protein
MPTPGGRQPPPAARPLDGPGSPRAAGPRRADWQAVLRRIRRERLDLRLRPIFDDLLIDALSESGAFAEMQSRLAAIPPEECRPRVWQAQETAATARLARLAQDPDAARGFDRALSLWDEVIRLPWAARSPFPAQFTQRLAAVAQANASQRLRPWQDRLGRALAELSARPQPSPHAAVVAAEQARVMVLMNRSR